MATANPKPPPLLTVAGSAAVLGALLTLSVVGVTKPDAPAVDAPADLEATREIPKPAPHPCTLTEVTPNAVYLHTDGARRFGEAQVIHASSAGVETMVVNCPATSEAEIWESCKAVWRKAYCAK